MSRLLEILDTFNHEKSWMFPYPVHLYRAPDGTPTVVAKLPIPAVEKTGPVTRPVLLVALRIDEPRFYAFGRKIPRWRVGHLMPFSLDDREAFARLAFGKALASNCPFWDDLLAAAPSLEAINKLRGFIGLPPRKTLRRPSLNKMLAKAEVLAKHRVDGLVYKQLVNGFA